MDGELQFAMPLCVQTRQKLHVIAKIPEDHVGPFNGVTREEIKHANECPACKAWVAMAKENSLSPEQREISHSTGARPNPDQTKRLFDTSVSQALIDPRSEVLPREPGTDRM